ncbi:hypothetical protein AWB81_05262 [Caballeronia arationis]|jgi:hypothetical protein|uniref:Uncharacterized protein n=1 Tax=Caballeronia arationis TaxID=1777142 RepID=A0A7Z7IEL2_9BURK|nr:hypothetical protein [Caballeronia arationis]SAK95290.1 hypothetical protein AWB81_05262 [Caballeronia arationis]SOE89280.1 hypothetical protein SAMN05446927_7918 [Caballeronia arationis]
MPVAALTSQRQGSVRAYAGVVAKPIVAISVAYCVLSNISFQSSSDGSLAMHRAAQMGLVSEEYADQHAADRVLFKHVGPDLFEYRVKRPILSYAGIPWLVARRTNIDLVSRCEELGHEACSLRAE